MPSGEGLWFDYICMVLKLFISVFGITFIISFILNTNIDTEETIFILEIRKFGEVVSGKHKSVLRKFQTGIYLCSFDIVDPQKHLLNE